MKVVSWNMKSARAESAAWRYLRELDPDIALLQEVGEVPADLAGSASRTAFPVRRSGTRQAFQTVVLARHGFASEAGEEFRIESNRKWVNEELARFAGNIVAGEAATGSCSGTRTHAVSVYSPPWPIPRSRLAAVDTRGVQLQHNDDIWLSDLLCDALGCRATLKDENWIVAGDFNAAPTFDDGPRGNRGNREWLDRMRVIGLVECLATSAGQPTPTFRHSRGSVRHQIDHLFVTRPLLDRLKDCRVPPHEEIWRTDGALSDHLPVIADFEGG